MSASTATKSTTTPQRAGARDRSVELDRERPLQRSRETFVIGGISRTTMDEIRDIATPAPFDLRRIIRRCWTGH